jgi:hypothetical protein
VSYKFNKSNQRASKKRSHGPSNILITDTSDLFFFLRRNIELETTGAIAPEEAIWVILLASLPHELHVSSPQPSHVRCHSLQLFINLYRWSDCLAAAAVLI